MDDVHSSPVRAPLAAFVLVLAAGCPLPSNVVYRCEPDQTCAQADHVCASDGWCYPATQVLPDGGVIQPSDGGVCQPRDVTAACANFDCGFVSDGCGGELECPQRCGPGLECGVREPHRCAVPSLCLPDGWCWENPLPQGHGLNAALRLDARHTWFVGEQRTVLFFDGERSRLEEAPGTQAVDLLAVHGTAADDVYAVGENATVLHFDGSAWEREGSLIPLAAALRSVWSLGNGAAIAAGANGRVLSRVAGNQPLQRWVIELFPSAAEVVSVFSDGAGTVYAVTRNNLLFSRPAGSPNQWTRVDTVPLDTTNVGLPRGAGLVFGGARASKETLVQREADGGWRALVDAGVAITALVPGDGGLFAFGNAAELLWVDDADAVTRVPLPIGGWQAGVADGPGALVVGPFGSMARVDRQGALSWVSTERPTPGLQLNAACGTSPVHLFAVGGSDSPPGCTQCNVKWLQREETLAGPLWSVKQFELSDSTKLLGCYAESTDRVWLTGNTSKFVSLIGGIPGYGDFGSSVYGAYRSAWGTPAAGYYFVRGNQELTYSADGLTGFQLEGWQAQGVIHAVWGLGADDILSVGEQGSASWWDGTAWAGTRLGSQNFTFEGVHGVRLPTGERRYVAAGAGGRVLSIVGDAGVLVQAAPAASFNATWVTADGTGWSAGTADGGAFVARTGLDGGTTSVSPSTPRALTGVTGAALADGGTAVWVVGAGGAVLRRDVP